MVIKLTGNWFFQITSDYSVNCSVVNRIVEFLKVRPMIKLQAEVEAPNFFNLIHITPLVTKSETHQVYSSSVPSIRTYDSYNKYLLIVILLLLQQTMMFFISMSSAQCHRVLITLINKAKELVNLLQIRCYVFIKFGKHVTHDL